MTDHDENRAWERDRSKFAVGCFLFVLVCGLLLILLVVAARAEGAQVSGEVRLTKGRVIVDALYPDSGFRPWIGTLISEHEGYGDEGFAGAWYWSLVYGGANMGLRVGATAPGLCSGPLDVKSTSLSMHHRMRTDTQAHLKHHVNEMWQGYQKGYRGRRLCEYVMLPSAPRDWGNRRFFHTDRKHRAVIATAYSEGRL